MKPTPTAWGRLLCLRRKTIEHMGSLLAQRGTRTDPRESENRCPGCSALQGLGTVERRDDLSIPNMLTQPSPGESVIDPRTQRPGTGSRGARGADRLTDWTLSPTSNLSRRQHPPVRIYTQYCAIHSEFFPLCSSFRISTPISDLVELHLPRIPRAKRSLSAPNPTRDWTEKADIVPAAQLC